MTSPGFEHWTTIVGRACTTSVKLGSPYSSAKVEVGEVRHARNVLSN